MNINSMIMKINNFNEYVIKSGFLRDVQEFIKNISEPQNSQNIVFLKDITNKVLDHLKIIQESDLPDDLDNLLPGRNIEPLRPHDHIEILTELMNDSQADTSQYHSRLKKALDDLMKQIKSNQQEIDSLYNVLLPFYEKEKGVSKETIMSFVFKDMITISKLKSFSKTLNRWDRALYIYHQLVSSKTPEDIELVNIQNGSLDVLLNIDLDVAVNLTEIIKYGLIAFSGYLLYKARIHEIVETYLGNKKLIDSEKARENELLENIGTTIKSKLLKQHKLLRKEDKSINNEAVNKKIDEVSKVLSEHIVKGNDIKLLIDFEVDDETVADSRKLLEETKKASLNVRNNIKKLNQDDKRILIEKYSIKENNE